MKNDTEVKIRCSKTFHTKLKKMASKEGLTYVELITKMMDVYNKYRNL